MGVRGLQTYIEKQCPEACKRVSLIKKAEEHRNKFNCRPELVVDGHSLASQLYKKSGLEWIYGGQYLQFMNIVKELVMKFKNEGIDLVFFFDGTVGPLKHEVWVNRRRSQYSGIASLFIDVKTHSRVTDDNAFYLPSSTGLTTLFFLKELGVKVYQTDREADEEIIDYAERNQNVFGILSQDSDFIICNIKEYFSLLHLDLESLHTIHYDRDCLARKLQLDVRQLPLFACLAGNDFVSSEKLNPFHRQLLNRRYVQTTALFPCLAQLIKNMNWSGSIYNLNELFLISNYVFGDDSGIQIIQDGLKSYIIRRSQPSPLRILIEIPPDLKRDIFKEHIESLSTPHIFNLLCKLLYGCSEILEDVSAKPSPLIYREVRQRCYGILFDVSKTRTLPNGKFIVIEEYCAYHGNQLERPELVEPLPLNKLIKGGVPNIYDIRYNLNESEKYQLFWSVWQLPMDFVVMMEIPKNLLVFSCIINFLIGGSSSGPHLKPFDVAVFVAQAVWEKNISWLEKLQVPCVNDEAVNLASLFMRGVATVALVLGICNYPLPITYAMPWHFFDGKLFHYLYTTAKQRRSVQVLCQMQSASTQLFYSILQAVTNNTIYEFGKFDWKTIFMDI